MRLGVGAAAALALAAGTAGETGEQEKPAPEAPPAETLILDRILVDAATRDTRPLLEATDTVSVREGEALADHQATTFEELMDDIPGVSIGGGPRGISQEPNIRGFTDDQIVLRFDGGRFNFDQGHRGRFFIDPEAIERIEVIRGGGSTLYGSGAMGGIISIETRDVDDMLAPGRSFGGRLRSGWSSNGETGQASATLYGRAGRFDALGFLGWQPMGTDLEDGSGKAIRDSEIDATNGLLKLGFEPDSANRLELGLSRYHDVGTTPPNANAAASVDTNVAREADVNTVRLGWDYTPAANDLIDLSVLGYYNGLEISEDRNADGRLDVTDYETLGFEAVNRSRLHWGRPVTFVYGFEALRDSQSATRDDGPRPQFPDATAVTLAAFGEATIAVTDKLDIVPGLRLDSYGRDPDTAGLDSVDETFLSPRIGISYRPTESWQIYGNLARAFRAPSLTELYNDGVHFAIDGFTLGPGLTFSGVNNFVPNPDLEPEKSTQLEFGTRFEGQSVIRSGDRLALGVNGYYADVEDYISQTVTFMDFGTITPGAGGMVVSGTTTTENIDARLWGFEAEAEYDARLWYAGLALSIPRGEAKDGGPLGSIPQDRLTATLGLRPSETWELGTRATFAADQDDVPEGSVAGEAFTVVDLFAAWRPQAGPLEGTVFRAGIDNLFDETYTIYPNELPQPGRTWKISAAVTF